METVTTELKRLADEWKSKGDMFRYRAYIKAIDDYKHGRGLTKKMQERILRILRSEPSINRTTVKRVSDMYRRSVSDLILKWEIVGSYRRGKKIMGDIDILVICNLKNVSKIINKISSMKKFKSTLVSGKRKFSFITLPKDIQVDIRFFKMIEYPYARLYFTGNRKFSIHARRKAISMGLRLNEYGLYYRDSGKKVIIRDASEKKILLYLGINSKYINPKNRDL